MPDNGNRLATGTDRGYDPRMGKLPPFVPRGLFDPDRDPELDRLYAACAAAIAKADASAVDKAAGALWRRITELQKLTGRRRVA